MNYRLPDIVTVIQTRTGSSRLPNKALLPLMDKPLFVRQVERVLASNLAGTVIVATTTNASDDAIENICASERLNCFRGSEDDLLDRHFQCALQYHADIVIKIPSDCPLIDPKIIDKVIEYYLNNSFQFDYVSNLHPATYPDGNDVEIISMKTLTKAWQNATKKLEREHTTPYIWESPELFRIGNVVMESGEDYSMSHRWTVDYFEDYQFVKKVYEEMFPSNPLFSYKDVLSLLKQKPEIALLNQHLAGVNWYRNHLDELKTINASQTKQFATK